MISESWQWIRAKLRKYYQKDSMANNQNPAQANPGVNGANTVSSADLHELESTSSLNSLKLLSKQELEQDLAKLYRERPDVVEQATVEGLKQLSQTRQAEVDESDKKTFNTALVGDKWVGNAIDGIPAGGLVIHDEKTGKTAEVQPYGSKGGSAVPVFARDEAGELYVLMGSQKGKATVVAGYAENHMPIVGSNEADRQKKFDRNNEEGAKRELQEETGLPVERLLQAGGTIKLVDQVGDFPATNNIKHIMTDIRVVTLPGFVKDETTLSLPGVSAEGTPITEDIKLKGEPGDYDRPKFVKVADINIQKNANGEQTGVMPDGQIIRKDHVKVLDIGVREALDQWSLDTSVKVDLNTLRKNGALGEFEVPVLGEGYEAAQAAIVAAKETYKADLLSRYVPATQMGKGNLSAMR